MYTLHNFGTVIIFKNIFVNIYHGLYKTVNYFQVFFFNFCSWSAFKNCHFRKKNWNKAKTKHNPSALGKKNGDSFWKDAQEVIGEHALPDKVVSFCRTWIFNGSPTQEMPAWRQGVPAHQSCCHTCRVDKDGSLGHFILFLCSCFFPFFSSFFPLFLQKFLHLNHFPRNIIFLFPFCFFYIC